MEVDPAARDSSPQDTKICRKCKAAKPLTEFSRDAKSKDGLNSQCKQCVREYQRQWYHGMSPEERRKLHDRKMAWRNTPRGKAYVERMNKKARARRTAGEDTGGEVSTGQEKNTQSYKYRAPVLGTPEYTAWLSMKARCYIPTAGGYAYYGGRGIKVCDRWRDSFENFLADMGPRPESKHGLGRLDPNGDYCPENCRWMTRSEQNAKRRPPEAR
ncbi:MAG: hypothetical protein M3437_04535 [Chloroflexota bacterium]|nr:hypothetical protein [Chloroflexota bacterium]MDQ5867698.1 hypothetical protein [Chloroflexota bacterium]